jgi:deoxycytidylate deaminase
VSPAEALAYAVMIGSQSPCAKSKRGVVVFQTGGAMPAQFIASGCNGPPPPFTCDGSAACRANCGKVAIHAEDRAIRGAGPLAEGADLLHVKVENGRAVASGGPSCWQCSRTVVDAGIEGVWLLHEDGLRRYEAAEFHRLTLAECGLHCGEERRTPPPTPNPRSGEE